MLKPQWWVNCKPLAEEAIRVRSPSFHNSPTYQPPLQRTKAGELLITPKQSENDWYRWLEGIQDWCISRQLWWGHRCPAYFVRIEGVEQDSGDDKHWVVGRTLDEAKARAEVLAQGKTFVLEQDEDVLDTWFSSGLWPFSILGWPDQVSLFFFSSKRQMINCRGRHPISRNSTHQVSSKQAGTSSSSGSHEWYYSEHT